MGSIKETIHPTLVVEANGQKFKVMLDTGAGSSFASSTLIQQKGIKPSYWEAKSIQTMTTTMHQKFPVYDVKLWSIDRINCLDVKLNKLDRPVLTTLNNTRIADLKEKFPYLNGIRFDCEDKREQHSIHLILGVGDMAKIKTATCKMGKAEQPISEKTILGWTLMGPEEMSTDALYFAKTSRKDYYQLYSLGTWFGG